MGSGGESYALLLVWVMNFFPQALLQSATHSSSAEDTIDFICDRYAYACMKYSFKRIRQNYHRVCKTAVPSAASMPFAYLF